MSLVAVRATLVPWRTKPWGVEETGMGMNWESIHVVRWEAHDLT